MKSKIEVSIKKLVGFLVYELHILDNRDSSGP